MEFNYEQFANKVRIGNDITDKVKKMVSVKENARHVNFVIFQF